MKVAADALHDVDQPVSEATLILNLLRAINPRFSATADFIAGQKDMTFTTALDQLGLKELRLANEAQVAAATALVAFSRSIGCSSSSRLGALGRTCATAVAPSSRCALPP